MLESKSTFIVNNLLKTIVQTQGSKNSARTIVDSIQVELVPELLPTNIDKRYPFISAGLETKLPCTPP